MDTARAGKKVSKHELERKKRELEEARQGNIKSDYFFILGKERRNECLLLIHGEFLKALRKSPL